MLVSAWVPYSDTLTPAKTVAELRAARVSTAVLMVNDFSTARGPTAFRTFDESKLIAMAGSCRDAEIEVWLCSWIMPHEIFIQGALEQIPRLLKDCDADLVMWDAEAPWVEAAGRFDRADAVECLRLALGTANMGVTAIGSAPPEVKGLANACSIWAPQCYATVDSTATPAGVVPYSLAAWRRNYGEGTGGLVVGLAAYNQAPDPVTTMQPPIDDVLAAGCTEVCYWTSNAIASRPDVTAFVARLSEPAPPHPGIMPTLDVEALPSGTRLQAVAEVQALLMAWSIDPGPLDGKPGSKTLAGVRTFQRRKGLEPTGVVDGATWYELLRP